MAQTPSRVGHPPATTNVSPLRIVAKQGNQQKIIYVKDAEITFSIEGGQLPPNPTYQWDVDGDGNSDGTGATVVVTFSTNAGAGKIVLAEQAANARKDYTAKCTVSGTALDPLTVRVALNSYVGTDLSTINPGLGNPLGSHIANGNSYLIGLYNWTNNNPAGTWSNLNQNLDQSAVNTYGLAEGFQTGNGGAGRRLQMGDPKQTANVGAYTAFEETFDDLYGVVVIKNAGGGNTIWGCSQSDVESVVNHEKTHVDQFVTMKAEIAGNGGMWASLDAPNNKAARNGYMELEAYQKQLADPKTSYHFIVDKGVLANFKQYYDGGAAHIPNLAAALRPAVKQFVLSQYNGALKTFPQLEDSNYDVSIVKPTP